MLKKTNSIYILVFLSLNCLGAKKLKQAPLIKVKIGSNLNEITVSGLDLIQKYKGVKKKYSGKKAIKYNCRNFNLKNYLSQKPKSLYLASISSSSGLVNWGKERIKGELDILVSNNYKSCDLVNEVPIEDYISALLAKEMNARWELEALKAQAVAARSYAYFMIKSKRVSKDLGKEAHYDLENSEKHQVTGTFKDETGRTRRAARETVGQILISKRGPLTPIFFHSKCGGKTWRPDQVWDNSVEGYLSVQCPYCAGVGKGEWKYKINDSKFNEILSLYLAKKHRPFNREFKRGKNIVLAPDRYYSGQLIISGEKGQMYMDKSYLRRILGRKRLPSNYMRVFKGNKEYYIYGEGNGHGVGMCQYGAKVMAQKGKTYRQILAHYFPNHRIKTIY